MPLEVILGAEGDVAGVVIDGVTYHVPRVDSTGHLVVVGTGAGGVVPVSAVALDIRPLAKATDNLYAVLKTDAGAAYDARNRSWTVTEDVSAVQDVPDDLRVGPYGRYAGAWQRQPLCFGFSAVYGEAINVANGGAGDVTLTGTAVPAGTLRCVTSLVGVNFSRLSTNCLFIAARVASIQVLRAVVPAAATGYADWSGNLYLASGEAPQIRLSGCQANDNLYLYATGYDMALNL